MDVQTWLRSQHFVTTVGDDYTVTNVKPRAKCADGWTVSIQASERHYCHPYNVADPEYNYTHVEVGFPDEPFPELIGEFAEEPEEPGGVYPFTPMDILDLVIAAHGGIVGPA